MASPDTMTKLRMLASKAVFAFKRMDNEERTMLIGAALCAVVLIGYLLKQFCGRRKSWPTEEEALKKLMPVIFLKIHRSEGEKLGMAILPNDRGTCTITRINQGDLVDRWNASEACAERRVRAGDRIVSVTSQGKTSTTSATIAEGLKVGNELTIGIAVDRTASELQSFTHCVSGSVMLTDMVLKDVAQLGSAIHSSCDGLESAAVEISKTSPALDAWNAARREQGACCTQQLEVGDRILAIGGLTNVRAHLDMKSPAITIAKFRPLGMIRAESFDVNIQRTGPEDLLGMIICSHSNASGQALVLKIADTGLIAKWNANAGNRQILKGDRIVSVNGHNVYTAMQKELGSTNVFLRIERWIDTTGGSYATSLTHAGITAAPITATSSQRDVTPVDNSVSLMPWRGLLIVCLVMLYLQGDGMSLLRSLVESSHLEEMLHVPVRSIPVELHRTAAVALLLLGLLLTLRFICYEATMLTQPQKRGTTNQLVVASIASIFLGYGNLFLMTWAGVYA